MQFVLEFTRPYSGVVRSAAHLSLLKSTGSESRTVKEHEVLASAAKFDRFLDKVVAAGAAHLLNIALLNRK